MHSFNKSTLTGQEPQLEKLSCLLRKIYKDHSAEEIDSLWSHLMQILSSKSDIECSQKNLHKNLWDSSTAVLITYADGVYRENEPTLRSLKELVDKYFIDFVSVIHLLPFLAFTSDGGFAVASYEDIYSKFGNWNDIKDLSKNHFLMADLVLNHVSSSHKWVQEFIKSEEPGSSYILSPNRDDDWSKVIRPRNTSLFTTLATSNGKKEVWTTFGSDQIDLDWNKPSIFIEFLNLILRYLKNGVSWIRLDAVGFIWKEKGTTCMHRNQVHDIVRALRCEVESLIDFGVLITETNVPEKENISYLQSGDEAHLAYNFPLPPLLLESLISGKADLLNKWLDNWPDLPINTGFLNFSASHDGIGLRALEGLMDSSRFHELLVACEKRGGLISHRRLENGDDDPYELNISWWSAMEDEGRDIKVFQFERFVLSQLFVIGLKGIPAFYLPSLLASSNDISSFLLSGERRDLNREKYDLDRLLLQLKDPKSYPSRNISILKTAMMKRSELVAFHPNQPMNLYSQKRSDIIVFSRGSGRDKIFAIHNMTNKCLSLPLEEILSIDTGAPVSWKDCLNNSILNDSRVDLKPYSVYWLKELL